MTQIDRKTVMPVLIRGPPGERDTETISQGTIRGINRETIRQETLKKYLTRNLIIAEGITKLYITTLTLYVIYMLFISASNKIIYYLLYDK